MRYEESENDLKFGKQRRAADICPTSTFTKDLPYITELTTSSAMQVNKSLKKTNFSYTASLTLKMDRDTCFAATI